MSVVELLIFVFSAYALATPITKRQAPDFTYDGDAPFSVNAETLAASLTCPNGSPTSSSPPVLLVHGMYE